MTGLCERGVDTSTVSNAGMLSASDEEAWRLRAERGACWFYAGRNDFHCLHAAGVEHAGIVYARQQMAKGDMIHDLVLVVEVLGPGSD